MADLTAGKPTVLVFWARWCGPCIQKIPDVVRLQETLEPLGAQVLSAEGRVRFARSELVDIPRQVEALVR